MAVSVIDYCFLVVYFLVIIGIGVFSSPAVQKWFNTKIRKRSAGDSNEEDKSAQGYFLAGRDTAWWAVGNLI